MGGLGASPRGLTAPRPLSRQIDGREEKVVITVG
jgi:hypothetical protein